MAGTKGRAAVLVAVAAAVLLATSCVLNGAWTVVEPGPFPAGVDAEWIDVSCPSATACVAVGVEYVDLESHLAVAVFDGAGWTSIATPVVEGQSLPWSISCGTPTSCIVVDEVAGSALVRHWDGTTWTSPDGYEPSRPQAGCAPDGTCVAIDEDADVVTWNQGWTASSADTVGMVTHLSCASADFCVGFDREVALRWDGSSLAPMPVVKPPDAQFVGADVSCTSATACVAVGRLWLDGGSPWGMGPYAAARWDGTTWTTVSVPLDGEGVIEAVSCASTSECVALSSYWTGSASEAVTLTWNGAQWFRSADQPVETENGTEEWLRSISCAPQRCLAVGSTYDVSSEALAATYVW